MKKQTQKLNKGIFKAYDIRGKYPTEIDEEVVSRVTGALVKYFKTGTIIIGRDARLSSPSLYQTLVSELKNNSKLKIIQGGLMTTPMLYFLVNHYKAVGGIMITASHNPKEFNGLKVVEKKAVVMSGTEIYKLLMS